MTLGGRIRWPTNVAPATGDNRVNQALAKALLKHLNLKERLVANGCEAGAQDLRRVPTIILTAHAVEEDRKARRSADMDGGLTKPLKAEHLATCLDRFLAGRSGSGAVGQKRMPP